MKAQTAVKKYRQMKYIDLYVAAKQLNREV